MPTEETNEEGTEGSKGAKKNTKKSPKNGAKKAPTRGKRKAAAEQSFGLAPAEMVHVEKSPAVEALQGHIAADGGQALAAYKDPLFGHDVILAALPVEKVEPTTFQRDVSESHVDKLVEAIQRTGRYLDPVICVRSDRGAYLTPNGGHRLSALKRLGAKSITALVLPERELVFKILALNVEKAHVLKERALEVIRMERALADMGVGQEVDFALDLEEPSYATLGACYEAHSRFAGSAYHPILRRIDTFLRRPLADAVIERERRAGRLIALEHKVSDIVKAMKEKGFEGLFLRNFVVGKLNPLKGGRLKKGDGPPVEEPGDTRFDDTLDQMMQQADSFDVESIRPDDVGGGGGGGGDGDEGGGDE